MIRQVFPAKRGDLKVKLDDESTIQPLEIKIGFLSQTFPRVHGVDAGAR